jgi:hypothetical protein
MSRQAHSTVCVCLDGVIKRFVSHRTEPHAMCQLHSLRLMLCCMYAAWLYCTCAQSSQHMMVAASCMLALSDRVLELVPPVKLFQQYTGVGSNRRSVSRTCFAVCPEMSAVAGDAFGCCASYPSCFWLGAQLHLIAAQSQPTTAPSRSVLPLLSSLRWVSLRWHGLV